MISRARRRAGGLWLAALATVALIATGTAVAAPARFDFTITIDPVARTLLGEGSITLPPGKAATLSLASGFVAETMQLEGRTLPLGTAADRQTWRVGASTDARVVSVRWSGTLAALDATMQHRDTLGDLRAASSAGGTFLPAATNWHPMIDAMPASYRVTLLLPPGQRGLVPGRLLAETDDTSGYRAAFEFAQAIDGIDLMAGPYRIDERVITLAGDRSVRLRTYFTQALADLAPGYLDSVAGYLAQYDDRIGAYPYTEFSVVSSPTPTGFGMPTLTYLGADVLRLPFIRTTSLGHEVLHNWWGNGVFPDHASGNWSEGLTTFMADYEYQRREGEAPARAMRLAWLRDFSALPAAGDTPLAAFTSRTHGASQIVGYNKAAMVFSMLRDLIGEAAFDQGLRTFWSAQRFRVASWDDLRQAFEQASNRDLAPFFAQWIKRPGAPTLHIAEARREPTGKGWRVQVRIVQPLPSFAVSVALRIRNGSGNIPQLQSDYGTPEQHLWQEILALPPRLDNVFHHLNCEIGEPQGSTQVTLRQGSQRPLRRFGGEGHMLGRISSPHHGCSLITGLGRPVELLQVAVNFALHDPGLQHDVVESLGFRPVPRLADVSVGFACPR